MPMGQVAPLLKDNTMPYPVKNFRSDDTGLNKITATLGSLVGILDACLVTGFNLRTLDALTYDSATDLFVGTVNSGHGYRLNQIVLVAGASPSQFNCEMWITAITATTFTGKAHVSDARPASAAASGSMTVKAAPQGSWSKPYASADGAKAVFRMEALESSKCCLRIDNSIACSATLGMNCLVDGYEQVGGIDVGVNYFGAYTERQNAWSIRARTSYRDSPWMLFADGSAFWLNIKIIPVPSDVYDSYSDPGSSQNWRSYFFGDVIKRAPGDAYPCLLAASSAAYSSVAGYDAQNLSGNTTLFQNIGASSNGLALARDMYSSIGKKIPVGTLLAWGNCQYSGKGALAYPSPGDNSLIVSQNGIYLLESGSAIRGQMPGYWASPQYLSDAITPSTMFENFPGAEARKFISMAAQYSAGTNSATSPVYITIGFVDITGPWR
jgi:hypothetical protein